MIRDPERLARFEAEDARRRFAGLAHPEALAWFEALWAEAAALSPFPGDWRTDLEGDFAIARAINGLPPNP